MTTAYSRIDRFLRENLNDNDYLAYKEELDALCQAKLQRTWVRLTDEEMEATFLKCDGKWSGDFWKIEDADFHPFLRTIESKLMELNI